MSESSRMPSSMGNYRIAEHEGCVVFSEDESVFGCRQKMVWERKAGCWCVSTDAGPNGGDAVMFADLYRQFQLLSATYGGNNEWI